VSVLSIARIGETITEVTLRKGTPASLGTLLYRTLGVDEICKEPADLQRRQQELAEELTELSTSGHPPAARGAALPRPAVRLRRNGKVGG
jgi:hypothetical protein